MPQRDFDEADCLLVKSQTPYANLLAEPCLTCRKIFHQPGDDLSYERITHLNGQEFLKSVQGNCDWCTLLWEKIERRGLARAIDIFRLLDTFISFEFFPTTNGIGNFNFASKEATYLFCSVKPTLNCPYDKCSLIFVMTKVPNLHADNPRYELPEKTSAPSCRILASQWISNCAQNHEKCRMDKISWLPTRFVDVGLHGGVIRLVETQKISKDRYSPYFTLSHRWGATSNQSRRLLSSNKSAWMKSIPTDQMPALFQDAIQFTRDMNVSYIWIDSLCIIQDSPEDWIIEAALMDRVYAQSRCNIAASSASAKDSVNKGLFHTRSIEDIASLAVVRKSLTRKDHQGIFEISISDNSFIDPYGSLLYRRAWVLQEQLMWECREERASETFPMGTSLIVYSHDSKNLSKDWRSGLQEHGHKFWEEVISEYMRCSLTYPSDRLVAIGAIAREFETALNDVYLAGLWKKNLPFNLLWSVNNYHSHPTRSNTYRCPTWSWGSLDWSKPISMECLMGDGGRVLAEVVEAQVSSLPGRAYTEYYAGYIRLKGKIFSIASTDSYEWLHNDQEFGINNKTYPLRLCLDIKIQKSECSRLYLIPITWDFEPFLGDLDTITII
ncbi:heterokaryon incompatibility protein [Botrytis cinerea]